MVPETAVAPDDLDALVVRAVAVGARAPRRDAVGLAVDRGRRHGEVARVGAAHHAERAAERDDLADELGVRASEPAGEDAAHAPAHEADRPLAAAVGVGEAAGGARRRRPGWARGWGRG